MDLITEFYSAFQRKDYRTMQSLYHDQAIFSDPVFGDLNAAEVRGMWEMLLTSSKDLRVEFDSVRTEGDKGSCHWEAWYTFTKTKRLVHNKIDASFVFRNGKIFRHNDRFDLWRWSRHALGVSGIFLGWSPPVQNKIRSMARARLNIFLQR